MDTSEALKIIAHMRSDFPSKFGIPRQSGLIEDLRSSIVFEPEFRDESAIRGLEQFSHLWLIWGFSATQRKKNTWSPTVRPPRLGGNTRIGVFATRSPFRPNSIGLSCVKLEKIETVRGMGSILHVSGADLMDGTPIYDIKPYLPYTDCRPESVGGFADEHVSDVIDVDFPSELLEKVPTALRSALCSILASDPRPSYQNDPNRIYGFEFAKMEIKFSVCNGLLSVKSIDYLK